MPTYDLPNENTDKAPKEMLSDRIARLERELQEAMSEIGLLRVGTKVRLTGTIVRVDRKDAYLPYYIRLDGAFENRNESIWVTAASVKKNKLYTTYYDKGDTK